MTRTLRAALALVLSVMWLGVAAPAVTAGGGGCHGAFTDEPTAEIKVAMNCFSPTVARVEVGDTVTWFSGKTEAPHTVTPVSSIFDAGGGQLPSGGKQSAAFDDPGVYPYSCLLHPGMVGAIVVGGGDSDDTSAAPPPPAPPAGRTPAAATAPVSLLPFAWGAGLLVLAVGAGVAARRGVRGRTATPPPSVSAP